MWFQILHNEMKTKPTRAIIYLHNTTSCKTLDYIGIDRGDIADRNEDDVDEEGQGRAAALPAGIGVGRHLVYT